MDKKNIKNSKVKLNYTQMIILGFALIVFFGAGLLMLPISSANGADTTFLNALFTSASASCVTGLVVYDTYTHWTRFGQTVILVLIQLGGLGFMSFAAGAAMITGKKVGLRQRELMQEAVNAGQVGGIFRLFKVILKGTFICESVGAVLLSFKFIPLFGVGEGIYYSIFHSISAFCNAGFDLCGRFGEFSSVAYFKEDIYVNIVLMLLIVTGGIGFYVWSDLFEQKFSFRKLHVHTKIVLVTTAVLIFVPAVLFFILERETAFSGMSPFHAAVAALFESVTLRTAGFDMIGQGNISDASSILCCFLMITGGSPGSTAGGIKTTTVAVLFLSTLAELRNRRSVNVFQRRLDEELLRRVISILFVYLVFAFAAVTAICHIDGFGLNAVCFEVFSAVGTVGLTAGITPALGTASKIIVIFLMFFGRIGGLSLATAFTKPYAVSPVEYPLEKISVG